MFRHFSVILIAACAADPFAPLGREERITPPETYRRWYAAVERCAGRQGHFDAVRWYVADSLANPDHRGVVTGTWTAPHTIRLARRFAQDSGTVAHESLHDILQTKDHPVPPFGTCG